MDNVYIPVIRISNGSVVTYSIPQQRPRRTEKQETTKANLTRGKFKGVISDKSRKGLKRTCENWLMSIQESKKAGIHNRGKYRNYMTFVTLTLCSKQQHSDNEIKRVLLNTFLIYAGREWGVRNYVWRAESQQNGNIHFHLFFDKYISYKSLRFRWNRIQERLGYVSRFKELYGHSDPNSTDIERIRSAKGASIYVSKYIAKESKYRPIEGRLWGMSDGLRSVQDFSSIADTEFFQLANSLENDQSIKVIREKYYCCYLGNIREHIALYYPTIQEEIQRHHCNTYRHLYKGS
jgi:hypothetical protein